MPERKSARENPGKDSMIEKMKSEKVAIVEEKSEKSNEENAKKPDREASATTSIQPYTMSESDPASTMANATAFVIKRRRSSYSIRSNIFSFNPSGGAGASGPTSKKTSLRSFPPSLLNTKGGALWVRPRASPSGEARILGVARNDLPKKREPSPMLALHRINGFS